ncbi:MAG: glycosyltransferase family 2 protein [Candidatus Aureabacteria bacterium]|nr:glycosyltransferase family 2 protein [Candidatus Auribacterota bacterium]
MDYSIVIPFYNEEDNVFELLDELVKTLHDASLDAEIIAVDDGSTDQTLKSLQDVKTRFPSVRIICMEKRSGQSAALWAGIQNARGTVIITMDGDRQNDPSDIPRMTALMKDHDAVFGWRKNRKDPLGKRLSSCLANGIRTLFLGKDVHDTGCGLKVMKKEFLEDIFPFNGMHRFFPSLLRMKKARFTECAVNHRQRQKGKTKYSALNRVFTAFCDLLAVKWMQKKRLQYSIKEIR